MSYWTGTWAPSFEAHSQEVEAVRGIVRPPSTVVSAATGQRTAWWPRAGVFRVSSANTVALVVLARCLEPRAEVSHLFGAIDNWHLLRRLGRRPLLFTVTVPGTPSSRELLTKVTRFAAETEELAGRLRGHGVDPERIAVVPPGVDLERFAAAPLAPATPFRLLFASSPPQPALFAERGVPLLIELARLRPDVELTLLWRPWGDLSRCLRALEDLDLPGNVQVEVGAVADLPRRYRAAHAVAFCPAGGRPKAAANSVIEGLASGRPALMTTECGLAETIVARGAGVAAAPRAQDLAAAIDVLRSELPRMSEAARRLAEERFDRVDFLAAYAALYQQLAAAASRG